MFNFYNNYIIIIYSLVVHLCREKRSESDTIKSGGGDLVV